MAAPLKRQRQKLYTDTWRPGISQWFPSSGYCQHPDSWALVYTYIKTSIKSQSHTHTIDMDLFIPSSLHLMITNSYCRDLIICKYWTQKCQKKRGIWKFARYASQDFIHILIAYIKLGFYNRCNIAVKTQFVLPNFYQSIFPDWSWYYILYPLLILLHVLVSLTNSIYKVTEVLYHGWKCRYKKAEIWKMMTSRIWAMIDSRLLGFTRLPGGRWGTSLW